MGCCSSTTNKPSPANVQFHTQSKTNRAPIEEEESIKEVLSETPTIPRAFRKGTQPRRIPHELLKYIPNPDVKCQKDSILKKPGLNFHPEAFYADSSDQSQCLSTASVFTDTNEIRRISPARSRDRTVSGENIGMKSQRIKLSPSPNRVRPGIDGYGHNAKKRDCGERSGRRSVSPAMRTGGVEGKKGISRSVSAGRNRVTSDRVKPEMGGSIRKSDDLSQSNREDQWLSTGNESVENPFVSLECFIFV